MGMQRIRQFRFTCDGEINVTLSFGEIVPDQCRAETVVEAIDKWAALRDLPEGWRAVGPPLEGVDVRCPREHVY